MVRSRTIGTILALIGILIVGGANTIYSTSSNQENGVNLDDIQGLEVIGYILIIVSLFTNGFIFVFEQYLLKKYYLDPF